MTENSEKKTVGYNGKILHIDLTASTTSIEKPDPGFYRTYLGGGLLGTYYVTKLCPPKIDPLSPENVLVFAPSITTGVMMAGISRFNVSAKSPLTGVIGDTQCGGGWGPMLKNSGYDAVVIKGKASTPKYIVINNGKIEIRDATAMWGKVTGEAASLIKTELGEEGARAELVLIGPAGEKLVKYANITGGLSHFAGRTGMGAVMGSKLLKAIIVIGKRDYSYANEEQLKLMAKKGVMVAKENQFYKDFHANGTSLVVEANQKKKNLANRNFRSNQFDRIQKVNNITYNQLLLKRTETCWACPIGCKRVIAQETPYKIDPQYGGPEFETIVMLGPNLDIDDLSFIGKANEICNKYGIDTISTGAMIAALMECNERGVVPKDIPQEGVLKFGDTQGVLDFIEKIATRTGLGDLFAEGPRGVIAKWGEKTAPYFMHVKNNPFAAHMPNVKRSMALMYAVNPFGSDHMSSEHDWIATEDNDVARGLGITHFTTLEALDSAKVHAILQSQLLYSLLDALTLCDFVWGPGCIYNYDEIPQLVNAVTGWNTTFYELMKAGERRINIMRAYNAREGISSEQDKVPNRIFEPLEGPVETRVPPITKEQFQNALLNYYAMMGWTTDGVPTKAKLQELGLSWI